MDFDKRNLILLVAGLVFIIIGFATLARGSVTLAPLLLVCGYCVLIPLALGLGGKSGTHRIDAGLPKKGEIEGG
jgi:hypothetical protein